ncbi:LapA family protein [Bacteroidota bacterium]
MKPEKKGHIIGGSIGLVVGGLAAYLIWGFESPGGILILFGFAIGGFIGWNLGKGKK